MIFAIHDFHLVKAAWWFAQDENTIFFAFRTNFGKALHELLVK
jgi:hypothetical protein